MPAEEKRCELRLSNRYSSPRSAYPRRRWRRLEMQPEVRRNDMVGLEVVSPQVEVASSSGYLRRIVVSTQVEVAFFLLKRGSQLNKADAACEGVMKGKKKEAGWAVRGNAFLPDLHSEVDKESWK